VGAGAPTVSPVLVPTTVKNTLTDCTTGIYAGEQVNATVVQAVITNTSTSAPIALYTDGTATGSYSQLTISGHQTGVKSYSGGAHSLLKTSILGFGNYGVLVGQGGIVTLGCSTFENGNSISSTLGTVIRYVRAMTPRLSGLPDVCAENNYWGEPTPPASKFSTFVDYTPWLSGSPPLMQAGSEFATRATAPRPFRAAPNPFAGSLTFDFAIPDGPNLPVRLEVFDVAGRLIWDMLDPAMAGGEHALEWHGRTEDNREVGAGIFFARLRLGNQVQLLKLVKVR
jgi:hypothetical protein